MHVHESGPDGAESIVFLHGVASSARMWRPHLRAFTRYRCLRPDFPGFGDSTHEPWTSIERIAAEVTEIVRTHANGPVHLVGMSLGGIVGMKIIADAPELVDRAVIDGASVLPVPALAFAKLGVRLSSFVIKSEPVVRMVAHRIGLSAAEIPAFRNDYRRMSSAAFAEAFAQALDFREPPGLFAAPCPTLFVAGGHEPPSTLASNRYLAGAMPNAQAFVLPRRWHGWVAGEPDLHVQMVEAWIAGRPLPPELVPA